GSAVGASARVAADVAAVVHERVAALFHERVATLLHERVAALLGRVEPALAVLDGAGRGTEGERGRAGRDRELPGQGALHHGGSPWSERKRVQTMEHQPAAA